MTVPAQSVPYDSDIAQAAALIGQGLLARNPARTRFAVTGAGARTLASFGINISEVRRSRRHFAGECIDWTQRRGHLNGALAAAITTRPFEPGWIARAPKGLKRAHRRSVLITAAGAQGLADTFGQCWPRGDEPV